MILGIFLTATRSCLIKTAVVFAAFRFFDKVSFERSDLIENVRAAMVAISNLKPEVIKGKYISQVRVMIPWRPNQFNVACSLNSRVYMFSPSEALFWTWGQIRSRFVQLKKPKDPSAAENLNCPKNERRNDQGYDIGISILCGYPDTYLSMGIYSAGIRVPARVWLCTLGVPGYLPEYGHFGSTWVPARVWICLLYTSPSPRD